jgi:hypothetical protein
MKKTKKDFETLDFFAESNINTIKKNEYLNNKIITFKGKYYGQPIEVLANDPNYCEWLINQNWFRERFQSYYQIIINNFHVPNDTPEHNSLQALFIDDKFCLALANLFNWSPLDKNTCLLKINQSIVDIENQINNNSESNNDRSLADEFKRMIQSREDGSNNIYIDSYSKHKLENSLKEYQEVKDFLSNNNTFEIKKSFEYKGWDVILDIHSISKLAFLDDYFSKQKIISVEIKTSLGDDYPTILRQIRSYNPFGSPCLIYNKFSATGATIIQIKEIFKTAQIEIFSIDEIKSALKSLL